jgi:hypothetical protein
MNTTFVVEQNEALAEFLDKLANLTGVEILTRTGLLVTPDEPLIETVRQVLLASEITFRELPGDKMPKPSRAKVAKNEKVATPAGEEDHRCVNCGDPFHPTRKDQAYCSKPECQAARKKTYSQSWKRAQQAMQQGDSSGSIPTAADQPAAELPERGA